MIEFGYFCGGFCGDGKKDERNDLFNERIVECKKYYNEEKWRCLVEGMGTISYGVVPYEGNK